MCQLHFQFSILNITKSLISVHEAQGFLSQAKLVMLAESISFLLPILVIPMVLKQLLGMF